MLCVYAIAGCDTTIRLYSIGKGVQLRKAASDCCFKEDTNLFSGTTSKGEIWRAGEEMLVSQYGGYPGVGGWESTKQLRYGKFEEKILTSTEL